MLFIFNRYCWLSAIELRLVSVFILIYGILLMHKLGRNHGNHCVHYKQYHKLYNDANTVDLVLDHL